MSGLRGFPKAIGVCYSVLVVKFADLVTCEVVGEMLTIRSVIERSLFEAHLLSDRTLNEEGLA